MILAFPSFFKQSILLLIASALSMNSYAQAERYKGTWVTSRDIAVPDEHTSGVVTIDSKGTTWNIFNNQLFFDFSNKMKKDTLLLLYTSCDCSKPYKNSVIKFPKQNTVFAKCYLISEKELGLIYTNPTFIASLKKYMVGTRSEKNIFPPVLYLNNEKPAKNVHSVKTL